MAYQYINLLLTCVLVSSAIYLADSARVPRQSNSKRCTLPQHPENGRWSLSGSTSSTSPGKKVSSGSLLNVRCNGQYTLDGPSLIECKNGKWVSKIGKCRELCPPVANTQSTTVTCTINEKEENKNCIKPTNGTIATFKCAPFYENAELNRNPFRMCLNGKWNHEIPACTPVCGVKPKYNSKKNAFYPWNAAVYTKDGKDRRYTCTGTLINERTILTGAHCITDELGNKNQTSRYTVAVGKSARNYKDRQDKEAQYSDVLDIFIPSVYKGSTRKYYGDIAVLITRTPFNMTRRVQPVCLDWNNKYAEEFENPKKPTIAGPLTAEYYPSFKNITEIEIPLVTETTCYDLLAAEKLGDPNFQAMYTPSDMYCSDYINSDKVPLCLVDHGVGLISKNSYDNKYYLIGVLHAFPSIHGSECDNKRWTLYTKLSNYISDFIKKNVDLYVSTNRNYFQISCGIKSVKAQTLIVNGKNVTKGDYPWQVAIYSLRSSTKQLICGGSLVNQRVILTAAHCVTDSKGKVLSKELFAVAVGKYYRKFDDPRDTETQLSSLKSIFVAGQYEGELQNFVGDIAILVTENSFVLTKQVQPVCVDWDEKYESEFLKPPATGYVAGWGYTQENQSPSEELKELEVPYIEQEQCKSKLPDDYEIYLTFDKLCSGFLNEGKSVCNGDSGGGLVFKNNKDDRYYLTGIVSLSPQAPTGGCDSQQYAMYTRVSKYIREFILEKVRLYWA